MSEMNVHDDHSIWEGTLSAYLLESLSAEETKAFRVHLAGCEKCQNDARWLRPAVDSLAASVEQVDPPEGMREAVLATVRAEAVEPATERPAKRGRRAWLPSFRLAPAPAIALTAAIALVAGIGGYAIGGGTEDRTSTIAATPTPAATSADGALVVVDGEAVLRVNRLPSLSPGRSYQVWLRRGDRIQPSTVFALRSDRSAAAAIPQSLSGVEEVLVSEEPLGGSDQPTSEPLLSVELT